MKEKTLSEKITILSDRVIYPGLNTTDLHKCILVEDVKQFIKEILDEIEKNFLKMKEKNKTGYYSYANFQRITNFYNYIKKTIKQKAGFEELE